MTRQYSGSCVRYCAAIVALTMTVLIVGWKSFAQESSKTPAAASDAGATDDKTFRETVQPLLVKHCFRCHNADKMKSGIRVDQLTGTPEDRHLPLWKNIWKQVEDEAMPPEDEPQPTAEERAALLEWIPRAMNAAMARNTAKNGSVRRLTVSQYRNSLKDLLGLDDDLTAVLPPDGISKYGFANHGQTLLLSPLQFEAYFDIAEKSLDLSIVDERAKPVIENFRMDLGQAINPNPCPDKLVLGALSLLLDNPDFLVTELKPEKPFDYQPFAMQTKFDFIEGYVGNDTIREWRKFDSIYHAVFACMRGSPGYQRGSVSGRSETACCFGRRFPAPKYLACRTRTGRWRILKSAARLPDHGNFRVTVKAAHDDGLLLDAERRIQNRGRGIDPGDRAGRFAGSDCDNCRPGVYQVDVYRGPGDFKGGAVAGIGGPTFCGTGQRLKIAPAAPATGGDAEAAGQLPRFLLLQAASRCVEDDGPLRRQCPAARIVFNRVKDDSDLANG